MPFQSKAEQRAARSTDVVAADRIVTSTNAPERSQMPQDKSDLTGGSLIKGSAKTPLYGSQGVKAKSSTLVGSLGKDGSSTYAQGAMCEDSSGKGRTTRETMGRREGFQASEQRTIKTRTSGKQGIHHNPLMGKLGK